MGWREWVKIWDGVEEGCNNIALKRRQRGEQISILTANDVTGWLFSSRKKPGWFNRQAVYQTTCSFLLSQKKTLYNFPRPVNTL